MNHQLHSIGVLAHNIKDNFTPTDYSFIKDFEKLSDLITYKIELSEDFERIAEHFLEEIHHIVIDIAIFKHKEKISVSQSKRMLSDFIETLKKNTLFPKLTKGLIEHLTTRDNIHSAFEQKQEEDKKKQESFFVEQVYYSLRNISLDTLFLIQSLYSTSTPPELFKEFLKTTYKANIYYMMAVLIIQDRIRIKLSEEKVKSITDLLHQSVELEAAYMYLLQLWKPDSTLPEQKIRNIEIVAATLEHKHKLAYTTAPQKLKSFLTQA